jgi:NDP-sugar pyrophosphorylase family protein
MNTEPTLLIMAAGMGSRYGGLKQLDEVGPSGETILDYSLHDAIRSGFQRVTFVIRHEFEEAFKTRFLTRWDKHIKASFAYQELSPVLPWLTTPVERKKPWGTGHAVLCASEQIDQPFAVINADDFYGLEAFRRMAEFLSRKITPTHFGMVHFQLGNTLSPFGPVSRGVCKLNDQSKLVSIREISGIEQEHGQIVNITDKSLELDAKTPVSMNFWGFHPRFFHSLRTDFKEFTRTHQRDTIAEFYLPAHVFKLLQQEAIEVTSFSSSQKWYGITYRQDREFVVQSLKKMSGEHQYTSPLWNLPKQHFTPA